MNVLRLLILISFFFITGCKTDSGSSNLLKEYKGLAWPEWALSANIYEVNIRQYTPEGSFVAFTRHIPRLSDMGVDILWLMPIFPISENRKKGSLGSYYAVSDYTAVNPEFGTLEDFRALVNMAKAYDMKVILDWVPNHTGWDHKWISEKPEYYTKDSEGNITDPINPETGESWGWTDVADLNYDNMDMRQEMLNAMLYWVKDEGIMGFRQDVAGEVPIDFWEKVTPTLLEANPDLFLLAEAQYEEHFNSKVFHAGYGWDFHHILNKVAQGEANATDIYAWITEVKPKFSNGTLMHFTSNHDENSWQGTEFERMGSFVSAMAVITYTLDGIPLVYGGQEEPLRRRLEFFEKDDIGFSKYSYGGFYKRFNLLKDRNKALWNGPHGGPIVTLSDDPEVLAFSRERDGDKIVVFVNLAAKAKQIKIPIDPAGMTDLFTGGEINSALDETLVLHRHSFVVWTNK